MTNPDAIQQTADGSDSTGFGVAMRRHFALDNGVRFLNHGSFGAVPRPVAEAQDRWRRDIERQPVDFLTRRLDDALTAARTRLANFVGAGGGRLAFVDNATAGVNAVLRSLDWRPGDRVVHFDHAYGAVRQTLRYLADRYRVDLVEVALPLPAAAPEEIVGRVAAALEPRPRLAVLDHITSPSALVLPIGALIKLCRDRDVPVLVDGAHAPGMVSLDISALNPDWYVGNCHKWLFAPRGCGFLWARDDRVEDLHPTVISHGYGAGFEAEFDWTGTRDYSSWLSIMAAIDFIDGLGADPVRRYIHGLAREQSKRLAAAWDTETAGPAAMTAAMAAIRLPIASPATVDEAGALNRALWRRHRIEVPVRTLNGGLWVRISAQVYNDASDYAALAEAVTEIAPEYS